MFEHQGSEVSPVALSVRRPSMPVVRITVADSGAPAGGVAMTAVVMTPNGEDHINAVTNVAARRVTLRQVAARLEATYCDTWLS
jgi:hypothetical protein